MNPNQKIAKLRDQLEEMDGWSRKLETRVRDAERQMTIVLVAILVQIGMCAAVVFCH